MREFLTLVSPGEALKILIGALPFGPVEEIVDTTQAVGRILRRPIRAPHPLPNFNRATVDGYALRSRDTHGVTESLPAYLNMEGEVRMGSQPDFSLNPGSCALIHTGGMLPEGADAVIMIENTQLSRPGEIEVLRSLAPGDNVVGVGEDVIQGETVIPAGSRLRPEEIGGLAALGITQVMVSRRPRVAILSSGDELVDPASEISPGQVRDVNSYTLQALIDQAGGQATLLGILPDEPQSFLHAARQAIDEADMVLFTAGSSVSVRDLTANTIDQLGPPGVLVHGVNVRPGRPTILAVCSGKPVIGLPGNPVSALVIARLFVLPALDHLLGADRSRPRAELQARLTTNLPSQAGREDWVPVRITNTEAGLQAEPIFGKSNLIFTLVRADGLIRIPADANGLQAGSWVVVKLMD